ncbi:hypothetical protein [Paraburkholderia unamae]|nr:hypothetical protein C7401_101218 [Paraburkholderia unamae]
MRSYGFAIAIDLEIWKRQARGMLTLPRLRTRRTASLPDNDAS